MAIKTIVDNLIVKYGIKATLRTYTTTTNEYGEVVEDSQTEKFIYLIFFNNITDSYLRDLFGISQTTTHDFLTSVDEVVDENSILIVEGQEFHINSVEKIYYKGIPVAQIIHCS